MLKPIDIGFLVESFAVESSTDMSFKIKYKFKNDKNSILVRLLMSNSKILENYQS